MFWRMTGLSAASPVDTILDKENFTLEELLDEDEIIQECKALNTRLINFLRDKAQVEQLLRYVVEEVPEDAEKKRSFKSPFIACEIFTCEIDVILRTLVEDEELMELLLSFVKPDHPHSTLLSGYFSKVVICLMLRKTAPLMNYVQNQRDNSVDVSRGLRLPSGMEKYHSNTRFAPLRDAPFALRGALGSSNSSLNSMDGLRHSSRLEQARGCTSAPLGALRPKMSPSGSRSLHTSRALSAPVANRPLSPHLPLKKPQLSATFSISHRIFGIALGAAIISIPLATKFSLMFDV